MLCLSIVDTHPKELKCLYVFSETFFNAENLLSTKLGKSLNISTL